MKDARGTFGNRKIFRTPAFSNIINILKDSFDPCLVKKKKNDSSRISYNYKHKSDQKIRFRQSNINKTDHINNKNNSCYHINIHNQINTFTQIVV